MTSVWPQSVIVVHTPILDQVSIWRPVAVLSRNGWYQQDLDPAKPGLKAFTQTVGINKTSLGE